MNRVRDGAGILAAVALSAATAFARDVLVDADEYAAQGIKWTRMAEENRTLEQEIETLSSENERVRTLEEDIARVEKDVARLEGTVAILADSPSFQWLSAKGTRLVARLVSDDGMNIVLEDDRGRVLQVQRTQLAPEDVQFLDHFRAWRAARTPATKKASP